MKAIRCPHPCCGIPWRRPLYELVMNLGIFALLWRLRTRNLPQGALFLVYLLLYSAGRFVLTFWSRYQVDAFGLNQAQLIGLVVILIALPWLGYLLLHARGPQALAAE